MIEKKTSTYNSAFMMWILSSFVKNDLKKNIIWLLALLCLLQLPQARLMAQGKDIEEMIRQLNDSSKNIHNPTYLQISEDQIIRLFDKQPSFGMYKDNYVVSGIPTNTKIDNHTADAKFQFSIRQRLTKSVLPLQTFLMLIYTQKSFWNVYEDSSPFADNNYNPGLLLVKPIIQNNELKGIGTFSIEHESNGRDSIFSRAWNYVAFSGVYFFNAEISLQTKIWYGLLAPENSDLFNYRGYGFFAINYRSENDKFWFSAIINPNANFSNINTQVELNYKPSYNANQYLFVQWYNGYGESLLDYKEYGSMIRFGICIKPPMRNFY
ncbi:MAG TPA: phospholipase A [Williamwhitmania sp.]|nr:phospholipase A [Williamwhitmania sp.]